MDSGHSGKSLCFRSPSQMLAFESAHPSDS